MSTSMKSKRKAVSSIEKNEEKPREKNWRKLSIESDFSGIMAWRNENINNQRENNKQQQAYQRAHPLRWRRGGALRSGAQRLKMA